MCSRPAHRVRGPFPGDPGFNHLPWWSKGQGDLVGGNSGNFFYVGGSPWRRLTLRQWRRRSPKNPALAQAQVEALLKSTALRLPANGTRSIHDNTVPAVIEWDTDCGGTPCDAVGAGVLQAGVGARRHTIVRNGST